MKWNKLKNRLKYNYIRHHHHIFGLKCRLVISSMCPMTFVGFLSIIGGSLLILVKICFTQKQNQKLKKKHSIEYTKYEIYFSISINSKGLIDSVEFFHHYKCVSFICRHYWFYLLTRLFSIHNTNEVLRFNIKCVPNY